jgi:hypothetical protein
LVVRYLYDFGDHWMYVLVMEKSFPPSEGLRDPVCLKLVLAVVPRKTLQKSPVERISLKPLGNGAVEKGQQVTQVTLVQSGPAQT